MVSLLAISAWSQGLVDFSNDRNFNTPGDRLVRDVSGAPLVGDNYRAQLYYGPAGAGESSLNPVTYPPVAFRASTTDVPGTWQGGYRSLTGFFEGQDVTLQVRVWDGTVAGSYEAALALNFLGTQHGVCEPFPYQIPPSADPPPLFFMEMFRGFTLVPEPSAIALAVLGAAGVLLLKRRK